MNLRIIRHKQYRKAWDGTTLPRKEVWRGAKGLGPRSGAVEYLEVEQKSWRVTEARRSG